MKGVILATTLVALLFVAGCQSQSFWPNNLIPMPTVQFPSQYMQMYRTISALHSALSQTPLGPFLPSTTQMTMGAFRAFSAASSVQEGIEQAIAQVNSALQEAAKQVNLPTGAMNQYSSQVEGSLNQLLQSSNS